MKSINVNGEDAGTPALLKKAGDLQDLSTTKNELSQTGRWILVETLGLAVLLGLIVWAFPPDVNEAHYLAKAKHFWDRDFCINDIFVTSHESHWFFYLTHGWLCRILTFEQVAWIGRAAAWLVTAWGMVLLGRCFDRRRGVAAISGALVVVLNVKLNLAGEWFVGGVEAKCYAYGFLFAALAMWMRGNRRWSLMYWSVASAFHVLVGLWFAVAASLALMLTSRFSAMLLRFQFNQCGVVFRQWPVSLKTIAISYRNRGAALIVGAFLLIGLVPAIAGLFQQASPGVDPSAASRIQSLDRLSHHQLATQFTGWSQFLPLIAAWIVLWKANDGHHQECPGDQQRSNSAINILLLNRLVVGALLISAVGVICSLLAIQWKGGLLQQTSVSLLTLYLFRLADVLVPLACVLNALVFVDRLPLRLNARSYALIGSIVLIGWAIAMNLQQNLIDPRSGSARQAVATPDDPFLIKREVEAERNWIATCQWIRENTAKEAQFITPYDQQTFKWYAHRSELASRKDMPQNRQSLLDWHARLRLVYFGDGSYFVSSQPGEGQIDRDFLPLGFLNRLGQIMDRFKIDYVVVEQRLVDEFLRYYDLPSSRFHVLQQVYPEPGQRKSTFVVFRQVVRD